MHSFPITTSTHAATATRSIALKHKLPLHLRSKQVAARPISVVAPIARHSPVDPDLLATVLRVHLEAKLRRERLRSASLHASHVSTKARVLQRAVNGVDEPDVQASLNSQQRHHGFQTALVQLSRQQC